MIYYYNIDLKTFEVETGEYEADGPGFCGCMEECDCGESARYNEDGFECVSSESQQSLEVARSYALAECIRLRDRFQLAAQTILTEMAGSLPT